MSAYHILTSITFTCFEWFQWSAVKPKPYQLLSQNRKKTQAQTKIIARLHPKIK